jgi:hypothetical protein
MDTYIINLNFYLVIYQLLIVLQLNFDFNLILTILNLLNYHRTNRHLKNVKFVIYINYLQRI